MKKHQIIFILTVILILILSLGFYSLYFQLKNNFNCPDDWIQNRHGEYFVTDGRRVDPSIEYMKWVKIKCDLKPTKISELGF